MNPRTWLHQKAWRPLTIAFVIVGLTVGVALDYTAGQRADLCRSNNRTTSIVKSLVAVTFDDGTPAPDPNAPPPTEAEIRQLVVSRLDPNPTYQQLDRKDQELVVDFVLILTSLGAGQSTAEQRLTALADSLKLDDCSGAVLFG